MSAPGIPDSGERLRPRLALVSNPDEPAQEGPAPAELRQRQRAKERAATDAHIGVRIRLRRTLLGIGQQRLASELGVSYQQVQNYECGANRISASMLWELSRALDIPVSYFFDDMPEGPQSGNLATAPSDKAIMRRQTLELVRAFYAVPESARGQLFDFVKSMARALSQH